MGSSADFVIQQTSFNDDRLDQLMYLVGKKVDSYKADKVKSQDLVSYMKILTTFADKNEKVLIFIGFMTAVLTGIALPSFTFLFGSIVNSFDPNTKNVVDDVRPLCINLVEIGLIAWVTTYIYYTCLIIVAERIGRKTRVAYLKAIL